MVRPLSRLLVILAGVLGAVGVAAAAAGSHGESRNFSAMAMMLLAHAPVLLALGLLGRGRLLTGAGLVLGAGTAIFALDLGQRQYLGQGFFPGAAPLAGGSMMLGWLGVVIAGAIGSGRA